MKRIRNDEVKKVAQLARLELNESEIQKHAEQLEKILEYIKQLEKIDTDMLRIKRLLRTAYIMLFILNPIFAIFSVVME